ncbi:MAG: hypothetical protein EYC70_04165 [Planctomycetota bacterium]|nr:MAG: hypothetical protein EYC70_04165 [Planctomycetota bacterium]
MSTGPALLLIAFGPLCGSLPPRAGLPLLLAGAGAAGFLAGDLEFAARGGAVALAAAAVFAAARRHGVAPAWTSMIWLALFLVPRWGPALGVVPAAWLWPFWPGAPLAGAGGWDPLREPALYERWGGVGVVPASPLWMWLLALGAVAAGLYWLGLRRRRAPHASER